MTPRVALRLLRTWLVLALAAGSVAGAETNGPIASLAELQGKMEAHLAQSHFTGALWGVKVVSLDSGKTLFESHSRKLFSPASNSKLYTVATALDRLGPDYRIVTSLYARSRPTDRGVLDGDLILFGRGDPTLNARLHGGRLADALAPLVAAVTNAGIRRIRGDVVADDSFFVGPSLGSGWSWDDSQYSYGAEISALTFNDNVFQVRVAPGERVGDPCDLRLSPPWRGLVLSNRTETAPDSARRTVAFYRPPGHNVVYASGQMPLGTNVYQEDVTVDRPAAVFLAWFLEGLQRAGVKWSGKSRVVGALERPEPLDTSGLVEIGRMESPPLTDIAREIQKPSQNLYTDLLLAHLGEKLGRTATNRAATSEDLGIAQLNRFLREIGVPHGHVFFEEGSGLSRNNLTTPEATVQLLRHMDRHPAREAFFQALPVAGVDGTLRNRMKDTPAAGNARAKTGTLRWANALSGYLTTAAGERLAFSIMLNRYANDDPRRSGRAEVDALVVMLASLAARSDAAP